MKTFIALNFELPTAAADLLPEWLLLVPAGPFTGRDGRSWVNDQPDQAVAYNQSMKRDVVWDFEHATELQAPGGKPAPAAGWVKELKVQDGQIWGRVEWNELGAAAISKKEYRYYSPAFLADGDRRVLGLSSIGFTNKHNLFELPALNQQQEDDMSLSAAIRKSLGLSETANDADAVVVIEQLKSDKQVALNAQNTPDPTKFVPRADYEMVVGQRDQAQVALNTQQKKDKEKEITELVDKAIADKKVAPTSREYHIATCQQEGGVDRFKQLMSVTAPVLTDTGLDMKDPKDGGAALALNAEQQGIAAIFGNSAEDIAKYGSR